MRAALLLDGPCVTRRGATRERRATRPQKVARGFPGASPRQGSSPPNHPDNLAFGARHSFHTLHGLSHKSSAAIFARFRANRYGASRRRYAHRDARAKHSPAPHPSHKLGPRTEETKLVMGGAGGGGLAITDPQAYGGSFLAKRAYEGSFRLRCSCETPCGNDMTTARIPLSARRFAGTLERSGRHGKGLRWESPVGAATRGNAGENRDTPRGCVRNPRTRTCDAPRGQSQRGDQRCGGL
jgi:hypothetical protein